MSVRNRLGFFILGLMAISMAAYSQERFQAHVDFTIGYPQDEFRANIEGLAYGGSGHFLYRLPHSPVYVGLTLGVMVYGNEVREEPFSWSVPEVWVDVKTRNYILNTHFMLRFQPFEGYLRPYVDGLIGLNYIWTETVVYDQGRMEDDRIAGNVLWDDTALSVGAGTGILIRVYQGHPYRRSGGFAVDLDLGFRYLKGGNVEYMTKGSILNEDGRLTYLISESHTDLVSAHIGATFMF